MGNQTMRDFFESETAAESKAIGPIPKPPNKPTVPKPPGKPGNPTETDPDTGKPIKSPCRKSIAIDGASAESCCDRGLLKAEQAINLVEGAVSLLHAMPGIDIITVSRREEMVKEFIETTEFSVFQFFREAEQGGIVSIPGGPVIRDLPRIIPIYISPPEFPDDLPLPTEAIELPEGEIEIHLRPGWSNDYSSRLAVMLQLASAAKKKIRKMQQKGFCCDCIGKKAMVQTSKAVTVAEACIEKHKPGRPRKGEQRKVEPCNLNPKKQRTRAGKCAANKPAIPTKPPTRPTWPGPGKPPIKPTVPPSKPPSKPTRPTWPGPAKPKVQAKGKVAAPAVQKRAKVKPEKRAVLKSKPARKK